MRGDGIAQGGIRLASRPASSGAGPAPSFRLDADLLDDGLEVGLVAAQAVGHRATDPLSDAVQRLGANERCEQLQAHGAAFESRIGNR